MPNCGLRVGVFLLEEQLVFGSRMQGPFFTTGESSCRSCGACAKSAQRMVVPYLFSCRDLPRTVLGFSFAVFVHQCIRVGIVGFWACASACQHLGKEYGIYLQLRNYVRHSGITGKVNPTGQVAWIPSKKLDQNSELKCLEESLPKTKTSLYSEQQNWRWWFHVFHFFTPTWGNNWEMIQI